MNFRFDAEYFYDADLDKCDNVDLKCCSVPKEEEKNELEEDNESDEYSQYSSDADDEYSEYDSDDEHSNYDYDEDSYHDKELHDIEREKIEENEINGFDEFSGRVQEGQQQLRPRTRCGRPPHEIYPSGGTTQNKERQRDRAPFATMLIAFWAAQGARVRRRQRVHRKPPAGARGVVGVPAHDIESL